MSVDSRSADRTGPENGDTLPDPKRWIALAVILVAAFMDLLDSTVVNVAIPSIQEDLGAGYAALQWVTAGYGLAFAVGLITGGRLGDIYGRKRVFMAGVAGFTASSLMCAVAQSPGVLVSGRLIQGVMAAVMVPQVLAIIHVTFEPRERGKAFGMFGGVAGLAAVAGLSLGGVLVQWDLFGLGWRLIFLINIPLGIIGLLVGARVIRESRSPQALRLDLIGVVIATVALLMLVYPLMQGRELDWPVWGFVLMVVSLPAFAFFLWYERFKTDKDGSPLVALGLFKARSFVSGLAVQIVFYSGVGVFFLSWTIYMQFGLGWTPLHAGLTTLPFCIGAFVASGTSFGFLAEKYGRKLMQVGSLLALLGLGSYVWVVGHYGSGVSTWQMAVPLLLFGIGFGWVTAPIPAVVLSQAPRKDAGSASALINTMQQVGAGIGAALVSVVFFGVLGSYAGDSAGRVGDDLRKELAAHVSADRIDELVASFRTCSVDRANEKEPGAAPASCQALQEEDPQVLALIDKHGQEQTALTFADAFQVSLLTFMGTTVLAFLLMFTLPKGGAAHFDPDAAETDEPAPAPAVH